MVMVRVMFMINGYGYVYCQGLLLSVMAMVRIMFIVTVNGYGQDYGYG